MARNARRNYVRDGRGRFSSTPGGGAAKKPRTTFRQRQAVSLARQRKQTGRLGSATREAKARLAASRKKLTPNASPQQKAAVTRAKRMAAALAGERRIKTVAPAGVIRGAAARGVKKGLKGRPRPVDATPMGGRVPASQRPGSITSTLRGTLQALAKADAARIREIEGITGRPVRAPRKPAAGTGATVRAPGRRSVSGTLGDNLRSLAQSDARTAREMADLAKPTPKGTLKGGKGGSRKRVKGGEGAPKALVAAPAPAKPTRPTSKVLAPGRRRKVRGPSRRTPGTIAKPKGLKPGALAARKAKPQPTLSYGRLGKGTKPSLAARAAVLKEAAASSGRRQSVLYGIAARQAESLSISGNAPNRTGRGNNQLTRAARRAANNVVRLQNAIEGLPKGPRRSRIQRGLDKAYTAWMTLPKTRLPR